MHLCLPDPRCLCCLQCHDDSSLAMAIPPLAAAQFYCHCQLLSSHSCCCQPLLAFTATIVGWFLHPSLLQCLLLAPLSAAPIIDTFVTNRHGVLFLICAALFLITTLPPSMVVIPHTTAFNPCTPLCFSCSLAWLSLIHPGWLLRCISSCCCLLSAGASTCCLATASHHLPWPVVALPPPPLLAPPPPIHLGLHLFLYIASSSSCHQLLYPLLLRLIDASFFVSTIAVRELIIELCRWSA